MRDNGKNPGLVPAPCHLLLPVCRWINDCSGSHTPCLYSAAVTASTIAAKAGSEAMSEKMICEALWVGLAGLQLQDSHRVTVVAQWIAVWTRAVWLAVTLGRDLVNDTWNTLEYLYFSRWS